MFEKKQKTFQLWLFNYNNEQHNKKSKFALKAVISGKLGLNFSEELKV
jgi:hypothetical protein